MNKAVGSEKCLNGTHLGLMNLSAFWGLDWQSRVEQRMREIEAAKVQDPNIVSIKTALKNLEQLRDKYQARIETATLEKQSAVESHEKALLEGDETQAERMRRIVKARSDLLSYSEGELATIQKSINEQHNKLTEIYKRESTHPHVQIDDKLRQEKSAALDRVISLLDTPENREALTELAAVSEVVYQLTEQENLRISLRHVLN